MKDFLDKMIEIGDAIVYSYTNGSSIRAKAAIVTGFEQKKKHGRFIPVLVIRELIDSSEYDGTVSRLEDSTRVVVIDSRQLPMSKYFSWYKYWKQLQNRGKARRDPKDKSTWKRCQYCQEPMNPIYDPDDIYTSDNCGR